MTDPVRLGPRDLLALGRAGLCHPPGRAVLSALGIAIGLATVVVAVGVPASSRAALNERLSALGTNLLRAQARFDETTRALPPVPEDVAATADRIGPTVAHAAP